MPGPSVWRLLSAVLVVLLTAAQLPAEGFVCAGHAVPRPVSASLSAKPADARDNPVTPHGRVHALVIFAQFRDEAPGDVAVPAYAPDLFDPDLPGSLTHFYHTMSFGQLCVEGTVLPKRYTSDQPAAAYLPPEPDTASRLSQFAREILRQVDQEEDLTRFDNDGPDGISDSGDDDGVVDYVFLCVRSTPYGFLSRAATGIAGLGIDVYESQDTGIEGASIRIRGGWPWGTVGREGSFAQTVGTMAHEFGHSLGLPDLYDLEYEDPGTDSAGIGRWGLMGWGAAGWNGNDGPNPFCAWSLEELGWISRDSGRLVDVMEETAGLVVADLYAGGSVAKIPLSAGSVDGSRAGEEYLLLERRTWAASHYNRRLPAEGLLVWHIRPQIMTARPFKVNNDEHNKGVDLVCADGLYRDAGYPLGQVVDALRGRDNLDFWSHDAAYGEAHGGNMGDATDPFDGVHFTQLDPGTNPASDPEGLLSSAATALNLSMRRQGDAMMLDVTPPRWAGVIEGEVHWSGLVLVDGDLRVAPAGSLVIHPPARVLFAGTDRLRGGRNPDRCELAVHGNLRLEGGSTDDPVALAALHPGEPWYGLVVDPADPSRVWMPEGFYVLRDAAHGVVFPAAPPGAQGVVRSYYVEDGPAGATAGNGDGQLSPGESFRFVVEADNWSLAYERARVFLGWNDKSLVYPTWETTSPTGSWDIAPAGSWGLSSGWFPWHPGTRRRFGPQLTLSPAAFDGQRIEFVVSVQATSPDRVWQDTLSLTVVGHGSRYEVAYEVPGYEIRDGTVTLSSDQITSVRAIVQGEADAADLVVWSPPQGALVAEVSMVEQSGGGGSQVYDAPFQPPEAGLYQLFVRLRRPSGAVVLGETALRVRAALSAEQSPALVFLGDLYGPGEREAWSQIIEQALAGMETNARMVWAAPPEGSFYQPLLKDRGADGAVVVWLGEAMDPEALAVFRGFLERGGRLLLISYGFSGGPGGDTFLEEALYSRLLGRQSDTVRSLYLTQPLLFPVEHTKLELALPTEPVLLDNLDQAAGLRLDTGTYRAVYLPFDLHGLTEDIRRGLIASSLRFLGQQAVQGVVLDLGPAAPVGEVLAIPADDPTLVRARVQGAVAAAELMVRSFPEREVLAVLPMQQAVQPGPAHLFETALEPPGPGQYHLSLRLASASGDALFVGTGQRVLGLLGDRPAVLFLGAHYSANAVEILEPLVQAELARVGLPANVVRLANEEGALYENLLSRYLAEAEVVVWLGQILDERGQAAFRAFLERGGRFLLISHEFHTSPLSETFLDEVFYSRPRPVTGSSNFRSTLYLREPFGCKIRPGTLLELKAPAVPLLVNGTEQIAGVGVDNSTYRAVYLPFDFSNVPSAVRPPLIASMLAFLAQGASREAHLERGAVNAPPTMMGLESVAPRLTVVNSGVGESEEFRVGYQILLGEEVSAAAAQEEPPLAMGAEREIVLPVWEPEGTGAFHIRFGLSAAGQEDLVYGRSRPVYVVEPGQPCGQVALPGELSEGHGAGFLDYDNDGDLDLYLVRQSKANQLFRNDGGEFTQQAEAAGVADAGAGWGLALGDYDGDGDLDLYVVNEGANRFFGNAGDGAFVDVTTDLDADPVTARPLGDDGPGRSAGFFDYDLDGDLDLYLVNAHGAANRLYRNDEDGFAEGAASAGLDHAVDGRGLAMADYDRDGDVDLFVAGTQRGSRLCRNDGGTFAEVHEQMGLDLSGGLMVAVFGDWDNDGDPDLFVSNLQDPFVSLHTGVRLFRNDDGASFQPARASLSLGTDAAGAAFLDHDNDGDLDLINTYVGTPTPDPSLRISRDELYHNLDGYLVPVGDLLELAPENQGCGMTFGDFDGDGDVDWFVADEVHSRLYRNQASQNHWLQVDLAGVDPNPDGLGARVELTAQGGRQYREVHSAYGYCSQVQPWVHFGLADAARVDTLRVQWPDGQETLETDVAANQHLVVKHPSLITAVLEDQGALPTSFELWPNYPNPFNAETIISYQVPHETIVKLTLHNLAGQPVRRLANEMQEAGRYRVSWDGRDNEGRMAGSGVYFCRLEAGDYRRARRLVLLK